MLRRGRKNISTSSALVKPLRMSSRAMHGGMACVPSPLNDRTRQSASLQIGPPFSSSGGAIIHRLCTDHFSCARFSDKIDNWGAVAAASWPVCFGNLPQLVRSPPTGGSMPSRSEPSGRASTLISALAEILLLLVVDRIVFKLLTFRIGSARGNGAGFTIGRHDNPTANRNLSIFLDG